MIKATEPKEHRARGLFVNTHHTRLIQLRPRWLTWVIVPAGTHLLHCCASKVMSKGSWILAEAVWCDAYCAMAGCESWSLQLADYSWNLAVIQNVVGFSIFLGISGSAWDLGASRCHCQPLHLGGRMRWASQAPSQLFKGFRAWWEVKSPFALVQTNTYRRLDVCWLIWFVISDVTVLFWPITSW